ncbi:MAG: hypothetical protein IJK87_11625 [Prevotella sp.]|nr:hypothetical protein [Prevotella sp.]
MSSISLPRLWKVIRWQYPGTMMVAFVFAVWVVLFVCFHLIDVGFNDISEEILRKGAYKAVKSFWNIFPNILCIMVCTKFNQLSEKQMAYGYLMLPATMQEKFLASVLMYTIGTLFLMFLGFIVADALCASLYYALLPTTFISGMPAMIDYLTLKPCYVDGEFEVLILLDSLSFYVWYHSLCVLFATIIRRNAILYAIGALLLLFPFLWLRSHFATDLAGGIYDSWTVPTVIILFTLAAINYVATYKLFPLRTLIGHKYLAIL